MLANVYVYLLLDLKAQSRQIYTFWDFLGDVGGLMDMFILLGSPVAAVLQFFFGNSLNKLLIESIFSVQRKKDKDLLKHIQKRKPFKINCCNWFFDRKNLIMEKKALSIISSELDIVTFIRAQFVNKISQQLLFT